MKWQRFVILDIYSWYSLYHLIRGCWGPIRADELPAIDIGQLLTCCWPPFWTRYLQYKTWPCFRRQFLPGTCPSRQYRWASMGLAHSAKNQSPRLLTLSHPLDNIFGSCKTMLRLQAKLTCPVVKQKANIRLKDLICLSSLRGVTSMLSYLCCPLHTSFTQNAAAADVTCWGIYAKCSGAVSICYVLEK